MVGNNYMEPFSNIIVVNKVKLKTKTKTNKQTKTKNKTKQKQTKTRHCCRHRRRILPALRLRTLTDPRLPVDPANVIEGLKLMDMLKLLYIWSCNVMDKV